MAEQALYAVEMRFDKSLKTRICCIKEALSKTTSTRKSDPHIILFVTPMESIVEEFSKCISVSEAFSISFSEYDFIWEDNLALCLKADKTPEILGFQSQFFDFFRQRTNLKNAEFDIANEYHPGSWYPSVTLASSVPPEKRNEAETCMKELDLPITGYVEKLVLMQLLPSRTHVATGGLIRQ